MNRLLGVVGSPRRESNTEYLVSHLLETAAAEGVETQLFSLAGKRIAPCLACAKCVRSARSGASRRTTCSTSTRCSSGPTRVVFGTPVYMGTMTAQLKAVFDRARSLWLMDNALSRKVAAGVAVGEGEFGGQELALQTIYWAAMNHGMIVVGSASSVYGNWEVCGRAGRPGTMAQDEEALRAAEGLGRRLARLQVQEG